MQRRNLLKLLDPALRDELAEAAGRLLDPVAAHLREAGPTRLFDRPPAFVFDPVAASSYVPQPVELPHAAESASPAHRARHEAVSDPEWCDPVDLGERIRSGQFDRSEVLERFARRIRRWDPVVNAFACVTLGQDRAQDAEGSLSGVPVGVQDMICTRGVPTAAGSRILQGFIPEEDANAWARLSGAGALLAGKLNTQEFAAGTTGENDWTGPVRNPWNPSRHAGGAAGGAGAAVAAGLVSAAIVTDPGGSLRVPAAHCGVVGLKPTFGAIDRRGSIPLTWTTETLGTLARTVLGAAQISDFLLDGRASDLYGHTCTSAAISGSGMQKMSLRIGVPSRWLAMGLDPGVQKAFEAALALLEASGAEIMDIDLPDLTSMAPVHRAIAFSEASSIHEELILTRAGDYGDTIRDRQEAGRGMLASEYLKAWRIRGAFARQFSEAWRRVHLMVTPTSPVPAAPVGSRTVSTGSRGMEALHNVYTRYAAPTSSMGIPSLSVPCGFTDDGLPVGIQFSGPPHSEPLLFHAGAFYEAAGGWRDRHPVHPDEAVQR
jgi:aspartyl-tRNA(Asn)/glutamyl-tRNA(Gln) amidotransferase subunit A